MSCWLETELWIINELYNFGRCFFSLLSFPLSFITKQIQINFSKYLCLLHIPLQPLLLSSFNFLHIALQFLVFFSWCFEFNLKKNIFNIFFFASSDIYNFYWFWERCKSWWKLDILSHLKEFSVYSLFLDIVILPSWISKT